MDPRGWVSIIRTPFLYISDSTNRVNLAEYALETTRAVILLSLTYILCNLDLDQKVLMSGQLGHLEWIALDIPAL